MTLDKVKLKTINNNSIIGDGNISVGGSSVDIVTSWSSTTSDSKVPSEKLTKNSLDDKVNKSSTTGLLKNDGTVDTTSYSTFDGNYNSLSNKPTIPSKTSDLNNDSGFITSSSLPTKTSDLTNDGADGTNVFVANNDSRLSDARTPTSHTHTHSDVTDLINTIYPIGSIYMSVNSTSPQTLFGGTWEQLKDRFLLGTGDTYSNGATGGSADAIVVQHNHTLNGSYTYLLATSGGAISKSNNAGQTGTKVNNLLYQTDGSIVRTEIANKGSSGTGKNMPPYLAVYIWKRTA